MTQTTPTLYCLKCGYNLTGNATNRCPECGTAFSPAGLRTEINKLAGVTASLVFRQVFTPSILLVVVSVAIMPFAFLPRIEKKWALLLFLLLAGIISLLIYDNWKFTKRLAYRRVSRLHTRFDPNSLHGFRVACCALLVLSQGLLGILLLVVGCFGCEYFLL